MVLTPAITAVFAIRNVSSICLSLVQVFAIVLRVGQVPIVTSPGPARPAIITGNVWMIFVYVILRIRASTVKRRLLPLWG